MDLMTFLCKQMFNKINELGRKMKYCLLVLYPRVGSRRISEGVRFHHITLLTLHFRTDSPEQTV